MESIMSNQSRYLSAWNAAFNDGDPSAFDGLMAADYIRHYRAPRGFKSVDAEGFKSAVLEMRHGFPDVRSKIDDVVGQDNEFTIRWSSEGTHLNAFLGIPATGKRMATEGITVCRFRDDRLHEEWVSWNLQQVADSLGFSELQQSTRLADKGANTANATSLRRAHGKFVTGVTVVTGMSEAGSPFGLAVNAFMSLSLEPPTIVVCISRTSRSHDLFVRTKSFAVNILAADQLAVARQFAGSAADKFKGLSWTTGALGAPLIDHCAATFEAETVQCLRASTHSVFIGRVTSATDSERPPLVYMASGFFDPSNLSLLA
jgi:steroid delta-isomerase-like uncharacterized protein